ncbi:SixA phosphatase family protein [Algoriphagus pacificus]|uniref:Histidine phosphatase family protein n=1 Tax=Algoriphagus pacificus TaxID=2811234 RepID=A0ABS3CA30_9BACT|nr:phosphoglycerate mutase family protein [Algoriphagus pacificus]MBN7813958.1 histidine phosphatase family protein [Algoriphagus pacificus]
MKNLLFLFFGLFLLASCGSKSNEKTIYIVRHAEKELVGDDPKLLQVGQIRAAKLGQILADKEIKHVFSTDYRRTKETAAPTANAAGLEIQTYDPRNNDALVEQLKSLEGNVLVVGHSNTVGQIANYFVGDGEKYGDLEDTQYEFIYIVTLDKEGKSAVERKTYKDY